jgi:hypothetical protein
MNISWTTWNLLAAILLAPLYLLVFHLNLLVFHLMKRWETEDTRVTLRNTRVALVTFGGLPLLAYVLVSIACTLSNPIAVARVAFIYMAVLLSASLFFPLDDWRRRTAKLIADGKGDVPLVHLCAGESPMRRAMLCHCYAVNHLESGTDRGNRFVACVHNRRVGPSAGIGAPQDRASASPLAATVFPSGRNDSDGNAGGARHHGDLVGDSLLVAWRDRIVRRRRILFTGFLYHARRLRTGDRRAVAHDGGDGGGGWRIAVWSHHRVPICCDAGVVADLDGAALRSGRGRCGSWRIDAVLTGSHLHSLKD